MEVGDTAMDPWPWGTAMEVSKAWEVMEVMEVMEYNHNMDLIEADNTTQTLETTTMEAVKDMEQDMVDTIPTVEAMAMA
jgi:hypothetical protein